MIRKIRLTCGIICLTLITLLFLDFTGTLHGWFGWLAKIQFLPAVLALNIGVVLFLIALTAVFGRIYCSVICPLGVFQDAIAWIGKRRKKLPYSYSPALSVLRYGALALFIVALIAGISSIAALFAPYSAYGRIANNLFQPIWLWGNNLLAHLAERADSYAFYEVDVWMKSLPTFIIAAATFLILILLAWRNGRTYCNTICPVGTILGFLSRYSLFRITIDTEKCNKCGICACHCKAACINAKEHTIDYSRCVVCMDCLDKCKKKAISYQLRTNKTKAPQIKQEASSATPVTPASSISSASSVSSASQGPSTSQASSGQINEARRSFLTVAAMVTATSALKAQKKKVDGGLATIENKKTPDRQTSITPPGSLSANNFSTHCTACQLCVSACPNQVLHPSTKLMNLMQPEMSYEHGYCRPECNKCSQVCPTGAIRPITVADKSSTQIGHAVWIKANCVPLTDGVECGNCARHCPTGAIQMIPSIPGKADSPKIPAINTERCIGCGACENLCPARPFSAIYVEGHKRHRFV